MNWDKAIQVPFKSDVYFFITRLQTESALGHAESDHDSRQGIRCGPPARFGIYTYHLADPESFLH